MTKRFTSEGDLAEAIVAWLHAQHWEVYQEVATGPLQARADIVAVQDGLSWIVETKTTLSLALMAQAVDWTGWANFVSVAVPFGRSSRGRALAVRLLRERGIGIIEVREFGSVTHVPPAKVRRVRRGIADLLCEEHKTMAKAGSARGGYHTPFAATCRSVRGFVHEHPGCTLKELVQGISHHYGCDATARSCVRHWIGTAKIPDVKVDGSNREWRLFPIISTSVAEDQ